MEKKIFLLIAIFCIALVKSDEVRSDEMKSDNDYADEDYTDYSTLTDEVETGVPYPGDFLNAVVLSDASSLWGNNDSKRECFLEKYSNGSEYYRDAIEDFSEYMLNAVTETLDKVREKSGTEPEFETFAPKIQASANEFTNLLKEYQEKFSDMVVKGSSDGIKELMEKYKKKIGDSDEKLDTDILKLKGITQKNDNSYKIAKNLENTRHSKLTDLTNACKDVMALLKECKKE